LLTDQKERDRCKREDLEYSVWEQLFLQEARELALPCSFSSIKYPKPNWFALRYGPLLRLSVNFALLDLGSDVDIELPLLFYTRI
jgi:hypothetical protein